MVRKRMRISGAVRWQLMVGLLCIALVVLAGTLASSHGHEQGNVAHADCGLCATAHVSVQVETPVLLGPMVPLFTRVETGVPPVRPRNLARFALYIRPPPQTT